ncbi:NERD domain-containing protein [Pseudoclavibacter sp. RFBA6]|uniref:NERD domain-containing protein n=1 Tax=Pseudoclavibacter sp. RFBA6 TaxID=2080573 RepID=UPI000CE78190|nr:NERD domain-containing protein [Pseudoclavibacter sp. RFBA6]PPG41485.1 hypothetical protein C5C17_05550 [Pseudoclavibacter sp. RFBA6]
METQGWVAVSFVLGAAVAVIVALVFRARANKRWKATLDERENAAEAERKALAVEAERAHAAFDERQRELLRTTDARLEQLAQAHDQELQRRQMELDHHQRQARRSLEYELISMAAILQGCATLGLDGVLATNTCILVEAGLSTNRYVTQIDHVLITTAGALIVEHKRWRGTIFDGIRPSAASTSYKNLIDDSRLDPPFAVQIAPRSGPFRGGEEEAGGLVVRTHLGSKSPRKQVRAQAVHLSKHLDEHLGGAPWIETCVFYSSSDATVFTETRAGTAQEDKTAVVAGEREFLDLLVRRERTTRERLDHDLVERMAALLHAGGAKIDGFGAFSRGPVPLLASEVNPVLDTPPSPAMVDAPTG